MMVFGWDPDDVRRFPLRTVPVGAADERLAL
jgi:hypothetical protein